MLYSKRRMLAFIALIGSLAAILGIGFISNVELSALADSSARVQRSYDLLQTLDDLTGALTDTETNQRGFLLTQDPGLPGAVRRCHSPDPPGVDRAAPPERR